MTKETARELLPIMEAIAEGKAIQSRSKGAANWQDFDHNPSLYNLDYRIKPEPQLRPWMQSEAPVGALLKSESFQSAQLILGADSRGVQTCWGFHPDHNHGKTDYQTLLDNGYTFSTDSGKTWKPCGVEL